MRETSGRPAWVSNIDRVRLTEADPVSDSLLLLMRVCVLMGATLLDGRSARIYNWQEEMGWLTEAAAGS